LKVANIQFSLKQLLSCLRSPYCDTGHIAGSIHQL